jgi:hypothetical protein
VEESQRAADPSVGRRARALGRLGLRVRATLTMCSMPSRSARPVRRKTLRTRRRRRCCFRPCRGWAPKISLKDQHGHRCFLLPHAYERVEALLQFASRRVVVPDASRAAPIHLDDPPRRKHHPHGDVVDVAMRGGWLSHRASHRLRGQRRGEPDRARSMRDRTCTVSGIGQPHGVRLFQ